MVIILVIGSIGVVYVVFGGLKVVVVLDMFNGVGLLIVGVLVLVLGLIVLGEGDLFFGLCMLLSEYFDKLNVIGGE